MGRHLLGAACVFCVVATVAGGALWLYAVSVRQDWLGLAYGLGGALYGGAWAAGVVLIDRALFR